MHINKRNPLFARESKGKPHGTQGEPSNPANSQHYLLLLSLETDVYIMAMGGGDPLIFGLAMEQILLVLREKFKRLSSNWMEQKSLMNCQSMEKRALKAVAGNQHVTDKTLLTFMFEAESLMNSRPLTHVSSDCNDLEALTPNNFLLGHANSNFPLDVVSDRDSYRRKHWKHAQVMAHFWDRRLSEYLPSGTVRPKGDLLLLISDNFLQGSWPLAQVTRIVHSDDRRVGSAEVKEKAGVYIRPVTKLCLHEELSEPWTQLDTGEDVADKLTSFVRHVTLCARPPLRPYAFHLSRAAWWVLI